MPGALPRSNLFKLSRPARPPLAYANLGNGISPELLVNFQRLKMHIQKSLNTSTFQASVIAAVIVAIFEQPRPFATLRKI